MAAALLTTILLHAPADLYVPADDGISESRLYVGGVAGAADLADPAKSERYRAAGGGPHLHHNGWAPLTPARRRRVLEMFRDRPVSIELGIQNAAAWPGRLKSLYLDLGVEPDLITVNAFAEKRKPTPEEWRDDVASLRAAGLPDGGKVLTTFEFANFTENKGRLRENLVSRRADFQ